MHTDVVGAMIFSKEAKVSLRWPREWNKGQLGAQLLLEVILGLGLFATTLLLAFMVFPNAGGAVSEGRAYSQATNLARRIMERTLDKGYPPSSVGDTLYTVSFQHNGAQAVQEFLYRVDVSDVNPPDELKNIVVKVWWNRGGVTRKVELQCYLAPF